MAGWQSSSLVIRDPSRAGFETCLLCFQADQRELDRLKEEASRAREDGDDPAAAEERVNAVQRRMDAAWWRTAVWYARRKHISQCTLQTEENRARAQELLDRNAQSNRRAEQKRKGKEKEKAAVTGTHASIPSLSSSNEGPGPSYYYKDYVAPILLEENGEGLSMDTSTRSENAMGVRHYATSDSGSKGHHHSNTAMADKKNKCWTTMVQTRSRASATQPAPHSSSSSSSSTPLPPAASLTLIPPSPPNTVTTTTRPRPRSLPPLQPVKIKLTPAPDDDNNSFNTPTTSSPSTSIHGNTSLSLPSTSARLLSAPLTTDDDASDDNNNLDDEEDDEDGDEDDDNNSMMEGGAVGDDSTNGDLGYPSKLPFWVSANLVVRHPSSKDKETCLACMQELKDQRAELDSERDRESDDWRARSFALDEKIKDAYWLTNGNGRFRHMSECTHQTQDTREKAKVRLDRYLAMARQRMKARHQREKLEKKKRLASTGLTVNTGKAGSGANGQSGRQSSAERVTPEPHAKVRKSMNPKKVAAMAMNEDLRALSIMPGRKREAAIKGKASVMNTYENDFTDDDGDLADMPPPMLHDSGSERSPSVPPEPVKTPHSVSFRVTDEPYIYIKDSLHSLHPSLLNRDEHSSFFAASATLYASQGDSSKITAQTFFDTPSEHTSSLGSRKRSPHHLYSRREESKRRRVTPDVPKRAFAPPRSIKRPNEQSSA